MVSETVASVEMPRVPKIGAECLSHPNSVASVAEKRCRPHRPDLPVLLLHCVVSLEPATGENDAAVGFNDESSAGGRVEHHAANTIVPPGDEPRNGRIKSYVYAPLAHVMLD